MYNKEYKVLFIHVPKTAGKSMEQHPMARVPPRRKIGRHAPAWEHKDVLTAEDWRGAFKFGFVRHPLDRLVSAYFSEAGKEHVRDKEGFAAFVRELANCGLFYTHHYRWTWSQVPLEGIRAGAFFRPKVHFWPQSYFLTDRTGQGILVDFIGKFERLGNDWQEVCQRAGVTYSALAYVNKGEHDHYSNYYTPEIERLAGRVYARDFAIFGYSGGGHV